MDNQTQVFGRVGSVLPGLTIAAAITLGGCSQLPQKDIHTSIDIEAPRERV